MNQSHQLNYWSGFKPDNLPSIGKGKAYAVVVPSSLPCISKVDDANTIHGPRRGSHAMEVALTFGSLGDIIQLCQLAIQLGRAVGVGCGAVSESAKEYQRVRDDLDTFVHILMQARAPNPSLGLPNKLLLANNKCAKGGCDVSTARALAVPPRPRQCLQVGRQ